MNHFIISILIITPVHLATHERTQTLSAQLSLSPFSLSLTHTNTYTSTFSFFLLICSLTHSVTKGPERLSSQSLTFSASELFKSIYFSLWKRLMCRQKKIVRSWKCWSNFSIFREKKYHSHSSLPQKGVYFKLLNRTRFVKGVAQRKRPRFLSSVLASYLI